MGAFSIVVTSCLLGATSAQRAGTNKAEVHPNLPLTSCTSAGGCQIDFQVNLT
eukprot:CAMPEP_0179086960 /NCGR_PEP_ID=MMETSP0796-20121207/39482_1 /TAXON_ID=73915 /ORGANISM="Pyrodinium bahamense, Strain pbaha01" /LENGTH=52 /DNA_ID=CAMNT_0020784453 /DNA_START=51 /DNA_END=205 /DNA_ORIENTATION=-